MFLYSQDLSNYKTLSTLMAHGYPFLYSQDLSNYKTKILVIDGIDGFCILKI